MRIVLRIDDTRKQVCVSHGGATARWALILNRSALTSRLVEESPRCVNEFANGRRIASTNGGRELGEWWEIVYRKVDESLRDSKIPVTE